MTQRFPLTAFLCDLIRVQTGKTTLAEVRAKWPEYRSAGLTEQHAKNYAKIMGAG